MAEPTYWTPDKVAQLAGLDDFGLRFRAAREFARRYGCEARNTGRTLEVLCRCLAEALNGRRVWLRVATAHFADKLMWEAKTIVAKYPPESAAVASNAREMRFARGGSLRIDSASAGLAGHRVDFLAEDHYLPGPGGVSWSPRLCQHRVPRDGKRCLGCGWRLRGWDLAQARLRRALVRDQPEVARQLGVFEPPPSRPPAERGPFYNPFAEHA